MGTSTGSFADLIGEDRKARQEHSWTGTFLEYLELVRGAVSKVSLPVWAEVCDKSNASCSKDWKATVAPVLGLK
jgi:hypothetical protein